MPDSFLNHSDSKFVGRLNYAMTVLITCFSAAHCADLTGGADVSDLKAASPFNSTRIPRSELSGVEPQQNPNGKIFELSESATYSNLDAGTNLNQINASTRLSRPPVLNVSPTDVPMINMHQVIIPWQEWHSRLGDVLRQNWHYIYHDMGCFKIDGVHEGRMLVTVSPKGIEDAQIEMTSGDRNFDEFYTRLFKSAGNNKHLYFPARTRRTTFKYSAPFRPDRNAIGELTILRFSPMVDWETYWE